MYGPEARRHALDLIVQGHSLRSVAARCGVARSTLREWRRTGAAERPPDEHCFICVATPCPVPEAYAYLLGQYLGDGYLVMSGRVPKLRIACADTYPGIARAVDDAVVAVRGRRPGAVAGVGCSDHYSYWKHWPCVLPQHGPGHKHERPIVLTAWQQALVDTHPWPLVRGLIHSDGCRSINRVTVRGRAYAYPRYLFANESRDILDICGRALDAVGVAWRYNRPNSISVARHDAVALMEHHVGTKS